MSTEYENRLELAKRFLRVYEKTCGQSTCPWNDLSFRTRDIWLAVADEALRAVAEPVAPPPNTDPAAERCLSRLDEMKATFVTLYVNIHNMLTVLEHQVKATGEAQEDVK